MEGGFVPNAASGIGCLHFPSQCRPRLKCSSRSSWRNAWKNCSSGEEQLGADCSTQRSTGEVHAVHSTGGGLGRGGRVLQTCGWTWRLLAGRASGVEVQKLGELQGASPKCGESDRPRGQNFHQWDTLRCHDCLDGTTKSENQLRIRADFHKGSGDAGGLPTTSRLAVTVSPWCLPNITPIVTRHSNIRASGAPSMYREPP